MRKIIAMILTIAMALAQLPLTAIAVAPSVGAYSVGDAGGYLAASLRTSRNLYIERKFNYVAGKGFAAERANNLYDFLHGYKAEVIGDSNAANGADRKIINRLDGSVTLIQDKYYKDPSNAMQDIFSGPDGLYRYITEDGQVMQLEVPSDQYDKYIQLIEKRIEDGKFGNYVKNPSEAKNIVRKGKYTFEQAENLTRAGNIDSLRYDATNGAIVASSALGISFVLDYVSCKMNGQNNEDALKNASLDSLKSGSIAFCTYVVSSQLAKTGLSKALAPSAEAVASHLGKGVSKAILEKYGLDVSKMASSMIEQRVAQVLEKELITAGVLIVVVTLPDVYRLCTGKISAEQFAKNLTVTVVSVAGGAVGSTAGAAIGSAISPVAGTYVGAIVGGIVGGVASGVAADAVVDKITKDNLEEISDQMYEIVTEEFANLSEKYLTTETEANEIIDELEGLFDENAVNAMYNSWDRKQFAIDFMEPLFQKQAENREPIAVPGETDVRNEMKASLDGIIFIH